MYMIKCPIIDVDWYIHCIIVLWAAVDLSEIYSVLSAFVAVLA